MKTSRLLHLSFRPLGELLLLSALVAIPSEASVTAEDCATVEDTVTVEILLADRAKLLMHEHIKAALGTSELAPPRYSGFLSTKNLALSWTAPGGPYSEQDPLILMDRIIHWRHAIQKRFQREFLKLRPGFEPPKLFHRIQVLGTRLACESISLEEPSSEPPKTL